MTKTLEKQGYNQTEVGLIPEEWEVVNIVDKSTLKARIGWQGLTTAEYLEIGDYYLITGTDFENGKIKWDTCHFVDKKRYDQDKNIQIQPNDILITKDGTIGKVAFLDHVPKEGTLNSGVFVVRPKKDAYLPRFFFYILYSNYFVSFLNKLKAGSTISHLYQKDLISFCFPLPPLPEQQAIAEVLNDIDSLIEKTKQLIDKKRGIKTGTMQQLLTGRKRLHNFTDKWKFDKLINHIDLLTGYPFESETFNRNTNGIKLLRGINITSGLTRWDEENTRYWVTLTPRLKSFLIKINDVIIGMDGSLVGRNSAIVNKNDLPALLVQRVARLRTKPTLNCYFLFNLINSSYFINYVDKVKTSSAIPHISPLDIKEYLIPIPETQEQQAIAEVLSNMDSEIEKLEHKLEKYKSIKAGMMQELLTGKTRLV